MYGFERVSNRYPVLYTHSVFERGHYSELAYINRKTDDNTQQIIADDENDKLKEEHAKLNMKCTQIIKCISRIKGHIKTNIQNNRNIVLQYYLFKKEFVERVKKWLLYAYLKLKYGNNDVSIEPNTIEYKHRYDSALGLTQLTGNLEHSLETQIMSEITRKLFFEHPEPLLFQHSMQAVLSMTQHELFNQASHEWSARMLEYVTKSEICGENTPQQDIFIIEFRKLVSNMFEAVLGDYGKLPIALDQLCETTVNNQLDELHIDLSPLISQLDGFLAYLLKNVFADNTSYCLTNRREL